MPDYFDVETTVRKLIVNSINAVMKTGKVVIESNLIDEAVEYGHLQRKKVLEILRELSVTNCIVREHGLIWTPYSYKIDKTTFEDGECVFNKFVRIDGKE